MQRPENTRESPRGNPLRSEQSKGPSIDTLSKLSLFVLLGPLEKTFVLLDYALDIIIAMCPTFYKALITESSISITIFLKEREAGS